MTIRTRRRVASGERRLLRQGTIVTRYRRDPRFTVLVPDDMWEWYDGNMVDVIGSVIRPTIVEGLARYTNYRKFTVSTTEISK